MLWIVLGVAAAAFLRFGIKAVLVLIVALVVGQCSFRAAAGRRCALCRDSLAEGAKNALPVGVACALVGVIIGTLNADRRRRRTSPATSSRSAPAACSCRCC